MSTCQHHSAIRGLHLPLRDQQIDQLIEAIEVGAEMVEFSAPGIAVSASTFRAVEPAT